MNRRRSLPIAAILGGVLLAATVSAAGPPPADAGRPNILFILIDDMGWKDLGCAGSTYYETPHIDQLASEGVRFLNAYSPAPVCTPSRGAIFSGGQRDRSAPAWHPSPCRRGLEFPGPRPKTTK